MLTVKFYTFSKRDNSTKRPSGSPIVTFSCNLKAPTSVKFPILELNLAKSATPYAWNFCYIVEFQRYYFVKDWSWNSGLWTIVLEPDLGGTWKMQIGASEQYVLRAASAFNGEVEDGYYPATCRREYETVIGDDPWGLPDWNSAPGGGSYCVGIAGQQTGYLLLDSISFSDFFDALMDDDYLDSILGAGESVSHPEYKMQINPIQFIKSVVYYPFDITSVGESIPSGDIVVGYGKIPTSKLTGNYSGISRFGYLPGTVSLSVANLSHPQSSRGSYLNYAPYTNYVLYVPGFGSVQIDSKTAKQYDTVYVELVLDIVSGVCEANVYCTDASLGTSRIMLAHAESQIGLSVQVSQILSSGYGVSALVANLFGFAATAVSSVAGADSLGEPGKTYTSREPGHNYSYTMPGTVDALGFAGKAVTGVTSIANSLRSANADALRGRVPVCSSVGSNTPGIGKLRGHVFLVAEYTYIVDEDNPDLGRPLCEMRRINTLSGLIQCLHTDIDLPTTADEVRAVKAMMDGGFFYE